MAEQYNGAYSGQEIDAAISRMMSGAADGKSAYQIAVDNGFTGTEAEWLASLKGAPGQGGQDGTDGKDGQDGAGVPTGGTTGQMLSKASDTDFDTEWVDPPEGGITGTVPVASGGTGATTAATARTNLGAAPTASPVFTGSISLGRLSGSTVGAGSVAIGSDVTASGDHSHAENYFAKASGQKSHAEGAETEAQGSASHAEGWKTRAIADQSHAEGQSSTASGLYGAHAEGYSTTASGDFAAHAEGSGTIASGQASHAEGSNTKAEGNRSHAEGYQTTASGENSHAKGSSTTASGVNSCAGGQGTVAEYYASTSLGRYNTQYSPSNNTSVGYYLVIGKGTSDSVRANALRITGTAAYGVGAWNSSGADYAELFEWVDGNPESRDRAGLFVTLDGDKIRIATPEDDYILGVVSGNPSVVGDVYDDQWAGMFQTDIFGRPLWEDVEVPEEKDGEGNVIVPAHTERRQKLNPDYDHTIKYTPRTERPEWDAVGLLGKLVAVDDGSCRVNGWATVGEGGKATHSEKRTKHRVMARLDKTHIRVMIL